MADSLVCEVHLVPAQHVVWFMDRMGRKSVMASIPGPVRYRFRDMDEDVEVLLEGDSEWVERWRQELGLEEVGWLQPLQAGGAERTDAGTSAPRKQPRRAAKKNELVGPPPDPSRLPERLRTIGGVDLDEEIRKLGFFEPRSPSGEELGDILDDYDEAPKPPEGFTSSEPLAEGWLRELFRIAVRRFGVMGLPADVIFEAIGDRSDMEEGLLVSWLEAQHRLGRLVKIHGGERLGYGPEPNWMDAP